MMTQQTMLHGKSKNIISLLQNPLIEQERILTYNRQQTKFNV